MDTKQALEIAKKQFDINPGQGWAAVYHFEYSRFDKKPTLTVVGRDNDDHFAKVFIDVASKKIINAQHKTSNGGGVFLANKSTPIYFEPKYFITGISMNNDNNLIAIWGEHNITNDDLGETIPFIKISKDEINWINVNLKIIEGERIQQVLLSKDLKNELYVVTPNSIYKTTVLGNTWTKLYDSKEEIIKVIESEKAIYGITKENLFYILVEESRSGLINIDESPVELYGNNNNDIFIQSKNYISKLVNNLPVKYIDLSTKSNTRLKVSNNNLILDTSEKIEVVNIKNKNTYEINPSFEVSNFWMDSKFDSNNQCLYLLSNNNELNLMCKGGDTTVVKSPHGSIVEVLPRTEDKTVIVTNPLNLWEEFSWR